MGKKNGERHICKNYLQVYIGDNYWGLLFTNLVSITSNDGQKL